MSLVTDTLVGGRRAPSATAGPFRNLLVALFILAAFVPVAGRVLSVGIIAQHTIVQGPFKKGEGHEWTVSRNIPEPLPGILAVPWDSPSASGQSTLEVSLAGRALGPAHSQHADIRQKGGGGFSDWSGALYFSTPDDSDPNGVGRLDATYYPRLSPAVETGAAIVAALALLVLASLERTDRTLAGWARQATIARPSGVRSPSTFTAGLVLCTLIPYLIFTIDYGAGGQAVIGMAPLIAFIAFLGGAHVFITAGFYLDRHALGLMRRSRIRSFAIPVLIILCTGAVFYATPAGWRPHFYSLFIMSAFWHHARQNLGVYSFLSRAWNLGRPGLLERRLITWSFAGGTLAVIRWMSFPGLSQRASAMLYLVGLALFVATLVAALLCARNIVREGGNPLRGVLLVVLTSFFWPILAFDGIGGALSIGVAHGLQYYWFLFYVLYRAPAEWRDSTGLARRAAAILGIDEDNVRDARTRRRRLMAAGAVAIFLPIGILLGVSYTGLYVESLFPNFLNNPVDALFFGMVMGWTLSHYWVDARLWRMSAPEIRTYHQRNFGFLG